MRAFTLGADNVKFFVGIGPYFRDSNNDGVINDSDTPDPDAMGLQINNLDLGMAVFDSNKTSDPLDIVPTMFAMKATADSFTEVGFDLFDFEANEITIEFNDGGNWKEGFEGGPAIDFTRLDGGSLTIDTGGESMELDYAVPTLGIRSERARFSIDSFFHIEGGFHFRKIGNKRVTVATGVNLFTGIQLAPTMAELQLKSDANVSADYTTISNLEVDAVDFVLTNANAFVGYGNPDFSKSLKDQDIYGLSLSDVDLAFTMMSLTYGLSSFPEFYALKGSAAGIELHTGSD